MSAIEATLFTGVMVIALGFGVAPVSDLVAGDWPFVVGAVLVGIGLLGVIGGLIWAVWSEVAW